MPRSGTAQLLLVGQLHTAWESRRVSELEGWRFPCQLLEFSEPNPEGMVWGGGSGGWSGWGRVGRSGWQAVRGGGSSEWTVACGLLDSVSKRQSSLALVRTETCMQRLKIGAGTVSAGLQGTLPGCTSGAARPGQLFHDGEQSQAGGDPACGSEEGLGGSRAYYFGEHDGLSASSSIGCWEGSSCRSLETSHRNKAREHLTSLGLWKVF